MAWSGLIHPPQLQHSETDAGTQRTATWLELFFDLAFVLVVAELASGLRNDLTPHGAMVFAGLFTSVWWAWAGFTFYANRFDTDDLVYRLAKLAAMLAVAGLAASVTEATTTRTAQFAICQTVLCLVLVALYLCWALAVAGEAAAPILATARSAGLPLHLEHLPERFGLLIILVLGESVAAVAVGVHDTHWDPTTVTAAILAFVVAASLWWTYFDLTGAATTHTLAQRAGHRTTPLHDIYAYGHWPIALGLTAAGVGLEDAILHADQPSLSTAARWILCGGIALYLLSLTAIQGGIAGSLRSSLPWPAIGVPLILAVGLASRFQPAAVLTAVALILLGEVAAGLTNQRQGTSTRTAPKDQP